MLDNLYSSVLRSSILPALAGAGKLRKDCHRAANAIRRQILLTFDDGPHPIYTAKLLDELKKAKVPAIFFVVGKNLEQLWGKTLVQRAIDEGHQIANHTYSHPHLTTLSADQIRAEILKTERLIGNGKDAFKILRPPYGAHNSLVQQVAQELGYTLFFWNVDSLDWHPKYQGGRWVKHAMEQITLQEESIVLAHDIHSTTVTRVGNLIAQIRNLADGRFAQYS